LEPCFILPRALPVRLTGLSLHSVLKNGLACLNSEELPEEVRQRSPGGECLKGVILILGIMPKVKTNSSAKKRFKVTATGKIMHQKSFKRHILTKKSKKRKRNMRKDGTVAKSHVDFVKRLLRLR
jgi:large subunit ribosomal protein L35